MKFIQSYWTKPILGDKRKIEKNKKLYHLSSFLLKKLFPEIELNLVTDSNGIGMLNTEYYDVIRLDFDHQFFDSIDKTFWAVPKVLSLLKYKTPYIHIDGDLFITDRKKISEVFDSDYDVIVQSKEIGDTFEKHYGDQIKICYDIIKWEKNYVNYAYNCGIIGFKNQLAADRCLTQFMFMWSLCNYSLESLKKELHLFKYTDLNCLMEQHLLAHTCFKYNFNVKEVVPPVQFIQKGWCGGVDPEDRFFHPMGQSKYSETLADYLTDFLNTNKNLDGNNIPNLSKILRDNKILLEDMSDQPYKDQLKVYYDFFSNIICSWKNDARFPDAI